MYSNDIPVFQMELKTLELCYVVPSEADKKNLLKFYIISGLVRFISFVVVVAGVILHFIKFTKDNIPEIDLSEDIVVMSAGIGTIYILSVVTYFHKNLEKIKDDLLDFSKFGKPETIEETVKWGNTWCRYFSTYYCIGFIIYTSVTIREFPHCYKISKAINMDLMCETYFAMWLPYKVPRYGQLIIFVVQFLCTIGDLVPTAMLIFLTFQAIELLGTHFASLITHFQNIITDKNIRHRNDGIQYWVRYHNHILRMAQDLNNVTKRSMSYITLITALVLACAENQLIRGVKPLGALLFLIGWLISTLLLCHSGERLKHFTLSVHDGVLGSDWHLTDNKTRRDVVFILLRSQKPLCLDALPLGAINYSLFVLLLKTSYSYLTLLKEKMQ